MANIENYSQSQKSMNDVSTSSLYSHVFSKTHIDCSLDFLALIANEEFKLSSRTSSGSVEAKHFHEYGEKEESTYTNLDTLFWCDNRYTVAEKTAAAALLMASFVQHKLGRKGFEDDEDTKSKHERLIRLNQNQEYRRRLQEKGVYPIYRGRKQYSCSFCQETFEKEMFVWRHGVKHLEGKPFQCMECGGTFNRSDSLQRHIRNFHKN